MIRINFLPIISVLNEANHFFVKRKKMNRIKMIRIWFKSIFRNRIKIIVIRINQMSDSNQSSWVTNHSWLWPRSQFFQCWFTSLKSWFESNVRFQFYFGSNLFLSLSTIYIYIYSFSQHWNNFTNTLSRFFYLFFYKLFWLKTFPYRTFVWFKI